MTLSPRLPGWVCTRRINHSGFCWSRHDGVAVASAEPYASYLHFAPQDNHASISSLLLLQAGCPSWHPTNSIKALKVTKALKATTYTIIQNKYKTEPRFGHLVLSGTEIAFLELWDPHVGACNYNAVNHTVHSLDTLLFFKKNCQQQVKI